MELQVHGPGPAAPFRGAKDLFRTTYDLDQPVRVDIRRNPDERTRVSHDSGGHTLIVSYQVATSAMAREFVLHEFAHMLCHEQRHPSHTLSTAEVVSLALAGESVEHRTVTQSYQIVNHTRDIYADDVWVEMVPATKLVNFLEASLANAVAEQVEGPTAGVRMTSEADPEITAVNAAFALALIERHDLAERDHRLYDLAHAAATDAPHLDMDAFKRSFRELDRDPSESEFRSSLVDLVRTYARVTSRPAD